MPYFICPNCQNRSFDEDGREGLSHQSIGCAKCGFGFVFQLLEDYFPRLGAGFVACDAETRILSSGHGMFEVTGRLEEQLIGQEAVVGLHLTFPEGEDPISTTLEWGVRVDCFPAYDDDGGLLIALSPPA